VRDREREREGSWLANSPRIEPTIEPMPINADLPPTSPFTPLLFLVHGQSGCPDANALSHVCCRQVTVALSVASTLPHGRASLWRPPATAAVASSSSGRHCRLDTGTRITSNLSAALREIGYQSFCNLVCNLKFMKHIPLTQKMQANVWAPSPYPLERLTPLSIHSFRPTQWQTSCCPVAQIAVCIIYLRPLMSLSVVCWCWRRCPLTGYVLCGCNRYLFKILQKKRQEKYLASGYSIKSLPSKYSKWNLNRTQVT